MVQGLAFLSKKSWHTKNFANQEKVWLAEEQKRAEEQKTKELARQIQQEREEEELDKVAGTKKKRDRGIDWMYEGGNAHSEVAKEDAKKEAEEYLLGKEFAASQPSGGHFNAEDKNEGIYAVLKQPPVSSEVTIAETSMKEPPGGLSNHLPSVHDRNESFRMKYEDPMFAVSQRAREKQEKVEQTKALYERVTGKTAVDRTDEGETLKARKHSKKEKRHKSHKNKSKKRNHDDSDDDTRSYRKRSRRNRSRSPSPSRRRERSPSPARRHSSRDRSPSPSRRRDRSPSPARRHSNRDRRRRSRSSSEESFVGSSDYSRSPRYDDDRYRNEALPREKDVPSKKLGYGLIGAQNDSLHPLGPDALGPDRDLLESKRQSREEERRRQRERASTRNHRTPEEREAALRAMEMDARYQGDSRRSRASTNGPDNGSERTQEESRRYNPSFLHEVRRNVNGMQGETGLADRMRQNRNTSQRSDSDRFL